ncbi:Uncharacterized protein Fot_42207 [Forsythia ovata]|uniref:Uncharacterized protein n=1 Tax=Forsythia ovata TaxID=205694 RepID=A0ABD1RKH4_9LAMI
MRHRKNSIAKTVSNLAKQVQMLVEENKTKSSMAGGQAKNEEISGVEAKALVASHSHQHSELRNSKRYQSAIHSRSESVCILMRSTSIFDRLGDEADTHQRRASFHEGRRVGSIP